MGLLCEYAARNLENRPQAGTSLCLRFDVIQRRVRRGRDGNTVTIDTVPYGAAINRSFRPRDLAITRQFFPKYIGARHAYFLKKDSTFF